MPQTLLTIGPFTIYTLWIFVGLAVIFGGFFLNRLANKSRSKMRILFNHLGLAFFSSIIIGRILYLLLNWPFYFYAYNSDTFLSIFQIWDHGLSPLGVFIGLILSSWYIARQYEDEFLPWLDRIVVALIGSTVLANIGAFYHGLNYGNQTSLPWGVIYESGNVKHAASIHPVQIYSAIFSLILTIVCYILLNRQSGKIPGRVAAIAIISYNFWQIIEGFMRGDDTISFGPIRIEQIISLLIIILVIGFWQYQKHRQNRFPN